MSDLSVPKGGYGYDLALTVKNADGSLKDLTDYTITMNVWYKGNPDDVIVTGDCPIDVAVSGTCRYAVQDGDFDTATEGNVVALNLTKAGVKEPTRYYTLTVEESA